MPDFPHCLLTGAVARALAAVTLALVAGAVTAASNDAAPRGDVKAGQEIYLHCTACHALAHNRTGPRHCGLLGRRAGSVKGYAYSDAMQRSRIVWSAETLDRFLEDPRKAVPGTSMGYAGIPDQKERADLIAYLERANASSECRKPR